MRVLPPTAFPAATLLIANNANQSIATIAVAAGKVFVMMQGINKTKVITTIKEMIGIRERKGMKDQEMDRREIEISAYLQFKCLNQCATM